MAINIYADLRGFKHRLLQSPTLARERTIDNIRFGDDDRSVEEDNEGLYLEYLEQASRDIDNFVGGGERWRHFYVEQGTRLFVIDEAGTYYRRGSIRGASFPVASYDPWSVLDRSGDRSLTIPDLIETPDHPVHVRIGSRILDRDEFDVYPLNANPKVALRFRQATFLRRSRVEVSGTWGYSDERRNTGATLAADIDASTMSVTISNAVDDKGRSRLVAGQTLWLDNEQVTLETLMAGASDSDPWVGTIRREVNVSPFPAIGARLDDNLTASADDPFYESTGVAAAHTLGTPFQTQHYPLPIRQSCIDLALRKYRGREVEWEGPGSEIDGLVDILSPIAAQLVYYRRVDWRVVRL